MATKKATKSVAKKPAKKSTKTIKSVTTSKTGKVKAEALETAVETAADIETPVLAAGIEDPIGDTTDGEGQALLGEETLAAMADSESADGDAIDGVESEPESEAEAEADEDDGEEDESTHAPRPPAKLERLQKILAQSGVASRRKAEEMIEAGRVQVNGAVVTTLGTKADAGRDHIRVDGKLLHGAERLRYFVLNKPKGFVTTVKDPEGRPTVMQFFEKMRERLYPVGRLDYMSEGLLLVTNDGELANKLTKAGSGVEKVYLVKVAGQPTEAELDALRAGVNIERGKPGSPQVRTSPARIRQVKQGDNPWFEVVLIEGRNRELRKMFVAIGHFVEKIRRVGYGPLVLDQEPGNMRELDAEELVALRLASEGKLKTPKAKDVRRRNAADAQLPTVRPKPTMPRAGQTFNSRKPFENRKPMDGAKRFSAPTFDKGAAGAEGADELRPKRTYGEDRPFRPARPAGEGFRPAAGRPSTGRPGADRPKFGAKKFGTPYGASGAGAARPAWKKDDRGPRPPARFASSEGGERRPPASRPFSDKPRADKPFGDRPAAGRTFGSKPAGGRTFGSKPAGRPFADRSASDRPAFNKPGFSKPGFSKPGFSKPGGSDRPPFKRSAAPRRESHETFDDFPPIKPGGLRIDPIEPSQHEERAPRTYSKPPVRAGVGRPSFERPRTDKPGFGKPSFGKPRFEKPAGDRPRFERSGPSKPRFDKPRGENPRFDRAGSGRPSGAGSTRPPRAEGGMARPFTTSSGKPRAGGARPSSKPFKPGSSSKLRPGGFSKPAPKRGGFSAKPGGAKRSGPRAGGKKRG
jgi:23S rRNA pseudouridine2605 synthase